MSNVNANTEKPKRDKYTWLRRLLFWNIQRNKERIDKRKRRTWARAHKNGILNKFQLTDKEDFRKSLWMKHFRCWFLLKQEYSWLKVIDC